MALRRYLAITPGTAARPCISFGLEMGCLPARLLCMVKGPIPPHIDLHSTWEDAASTRLETRSLKKSRAEITAGSAD